MSEQKQIALDSPTNPRWLLVALGSIEIHQIQSFFMEPGERVFRIVTTAFVVLIWLSRLFLPARVRGVLWMLLSIPPIFGSFVGHFIPIVRDRRVPPASETAPFNLAGSVLLFALGASLALPRSLTRKNIT